MQMEITMANANEFVNDFLFEDKLVEMWPEYSIFLKDSMSNR